MEEKPAGSGWPICIDCILPHIDSPKIKILIGQGWKGINPFKEALKQKIKQRNPEANIIEFEFYRGDGPEIKETIWSQLVEGKNNYIFFNSGACMVEGFDKVINDLMQSPQNDLYFSCSETYISEIASRLSTKSVQIRIHTGSYREFLEYQEYRKQFSGPIFDDMDEEDDRWIAPVL